MRRSSRSSSDYPPVESRGKTDSSAWQTLNRLAPYLWQYKWRVLLALSCLIAVTLDNDAVEKVCS